MRKGLIICGFLSSLLYVVMNIICAMLYDGYSSVSQTVSELSAIDAPTRPLWVAMVIPYDLLLIAFGFGVFQSAGKSRSMRIAACAFVLQGIIGFFWPPMHIRGTDFTLTDTLHIAFTFVAVPLMMLEIGFGEVAFGKWFRIYSAGTLIVLFGFGFLTGLDGPNIAADLPTPLVGVWERISIGAFLQWVTAFAVVLNRRDQSA